MTTATVVIMDCLPSLDMASDQRFSLPPMHSLPSLQLPPASAKQSHSPSTTSAPAAAVPLLNHLSACYAITGGLFLPETPNSLVQRGYMREARAVLQQVRGTKDVVAEFDTIVLANEALKGMENPWIAILRRRNRPQLILAIAMPFFQ